MFNMDNFNKTNEWAKVPYTWTLCDILANVAKVAVYLASPNYPRKLETVNTKLSYELLSDKSVKQRVIGDTRMFDMSLNDLNNWVHAKLMGLKEFREWNLTSFEYENGVDPDASNEERYEVYIKSPENDSTLVIVKDFIDLQAFKQNLYCEFRSMFIEKCFFHGNMHG